MAAAVESGELEGEGFKPAGIGTEDDPYAISTPEAFAWWAAHKAGDANTFARLDADIDLTGTAHAEAGTLWTPIETLAAELDGQGHAILFRTQGAGLANTVAETGAVRWLSLGRTQRQLDEAAAQGGEAAALAETSVATEGSRAGAVAGTNKGAIEGVVNRMPVSWQPAEGDASDPAPSSLVGGIAGENDGRIADCANLGAVSSASASSDSAAAGIAGAGAGTVETSYNAGSVKAAANGAYLATALTADGTYEDLVRASFYLAPGNEAAYEGVALADRDGALPPDELQAAAELLNDGREGDAVVWRSAEGAGDASADGATRSYPAPARPANPDAAQAEPEPEALAAEPAPAAADDPAPAATPIFKNWLEVAEAVDQDRYGMGSYKELDSAVVSTPENLAWRMYANRTEQLVLGNDIDLSGTQYTADGSPLPWTSWVVTNVDFDGAGCTISGMHVVGGSESKDTRPSVAVGLAQSQAETSRGLFAGTGSDSERCIVKNLTIEGDIDLKAGTFDSVQRQPPLAAGGLIGFIGRVSGETVFEARRVTSKVDVMGYGFTGGIVGGIGMYVNVELADCVNRGRVFADGDVYDQVVDVDVINHRISSRARIASAGGLVGAVALGGPVTNAGVRIERCNNIGTVSSNFYAGGLVGYANGLVGYADKIVLTVNQSFNEGSVESKRGYGGVLTETKDVIRAGGGIAGGLIGLAFESVYTQDCYNRGPVHSGFLAGGIFGSATIESSPTNLLYSTYSAARVTASYYGPQTEGGFLQTNEKAPRGQGGAVAGYMYARVEAGGLQQLSFDADLTSQAFQHGASGPYTASMRFTTSEMKDDKAYVNHLNSYSKTAVWSRAPERNDGYPSLVVVGDKRYNSWAAVGKAVYDNPSQFDEECDPRNYGIGTKEYPYRVLTPEALAVVFYMMQNKDASRRDRFLSITLGADIDLSGTKYGGLAWNSTSGADSALEWIPFYSGVFYGSFEGAGHTISGLSVKANSSYNEAIGGLFAAVDTSAWAYTEGLETSIGGFAIEGILATNGDSLGGVVGMAGAVDAETRSRVILHDIESRVTFKNFEASANRNYLGGVVGKAAFASPVVIQRCGFSGSFDYPAEYDYFGSVGGIVGEAGSSDMWTELEDCYSTGTVNIGNAKRVSRVGGLAGKLSGSIKNSYVKPLSFSVGNVNADTALLVVDWSSVGDSIRVFYDEGDLEKFRMPRVAYGNIADKVFVTMSSDYMMKGGFAASLNCNRENPVWGSPAAGENGGFPVLHGVPDVASWMEIGEAIYKKYLVDPEYRPFSPEESNGTYVLRTPEDLAYYACYIRETWLFAPDNPSYRDEESDMTPSSIQKSARIEAPAMDMAGEPYGGTSGEPLAWEPIGNSYWKESAGKSVGRPLFNTAFDGGDSVISHLRVQGPTDENDLKVEGRSLSAALIGEAVRCTVKNVRLDRTCSSAGYLSASESKLYTVAGIVGTARSTLVENCSSSATVTAVYNNASFYDSRTALAAGGVVGAAYDELNIYESKAMISRCSNAGTVISKDVGANPTNNYVVIAGIVGAAWRGYGQCYLEDCYNVGAIGRNGDKSIAASITGGPADLAGAEKSPIVRTCYNAGVIASSTSVFAICGASSDDGYSDPERPNFLVSDDPSEPGYFDRGHYAEWSISEGKLTTFAMALNAGRVGKDAPWVFDSENVNGGLPVFGINFGAWAEVGEAVANGKLTGDGFVPTQAGTVDDPYQISTPEALAWFAYKVNTDRAYGVKSAKLMANIDLDGSKYTAAAKSLANAMPWTPIGNDATYWFGADAAASGQGEYKTVVFDGNGKTVDYMLVNRTVAYSGLIGCTHNCTIKGVTIGQNSSVTGTSRVGGVAGGYEIWSPNSTCAMLVENCFNYASAKGSDKVGGIIGNLPYNAAETNALVRCGNYGDVTCTTSSRGCSGGVVGQAGGSGVAYCFNRGNLTFSGSYTNMLGGVSGQGGKVRYSYNAGKMNKGYSISGTYSSGTADATCLRTSDSGGTAQGITVSPDQMKSWAAAYALNDKNYGSGTAWAYDAAANDGYPSFGELRAAADWGEVGLGVDAGLIAGKPTQTGADAATAFQLGTEEALAWFAYKSNTEDTSTAYTKYATITASALDLTGTTYGGTSEAKLQWSSIAKVSGGHGTVPGTFGGTFDGQRCVIKNLYQSNPSAAAGTGWGLFAFLYGGTVKNVVLDGIDINVSSSGNWATAGGIASQTAGGAVISGCAVNGGFIAGPTNGTAQMVGGIVGDSHAGGSTIENCYARASVKATGGSGGGGILGRANNGPVAIKNCYFAGAAQGSPLCYQKAGVATFTNCYYDSTLFTAGAERTGVKGLSTAQLKSWAAAYALNGKDFGSGTAWAYDAAANDGYPSFGELRAAADWGEVGLGVDAGLIDGKPKQSGADAANAFQLGSPEALAWFAYKSRGTNGSSYRAHAKLTAPIDLSGKDYTGESEIADDFSNCLEWKPVGWHQATFDGAGHYVENLRCDNGVFEKVSGTVQDFGVESGRVGGSGTVGAVASELDGVNAKMLRCYNKADVVAGSEKQYIYVGGLVGSVVKNNGSMVSDCFNTGNVTVNRTGGGSANSAYAGGVAGYSGSSMANCYSAGAVAQNVAASNSQSNMVTTENGVSLSNCYYDSSFMKEGNKAGSCKSLTTEQLKSWAAARALNNKKVGSGTVWTCDPDANQGYPSFGTLAAPADWGEVGLGVDAGLVTGAGFKPSGEGTSEKPYQISTPEALAWLAYKMSSDNSNYKSKHAKLAASIDLSGKDYGGTAADGDFSSCIKWEPLGTDAANFFGRFDGDGKTVRNLRVDRSESGAAGLFGLLGSGGVVVGLGVESGSVKGTGCSGGVVGTAHGTVERCWNGASVSSYANSSGGGIVGFTYGTVKDCYNLGAVGKSGNEGGIVGYAGDGTSVVKNCYNAGKSVSGAVVGVEGKGAIVAGNYYLEGTGDAAGLEADKARELTAEQLKSWGAAYALNDRKTGSGTVWTCDPDVNQGYPSFGTLGAPADWGEVGAGVDAGLISGKPTQAGNAMDPYDLASSEALAWFAYKVNTDKVNYNKKRAKLTASIDLSGKDYTGAGEIEANFSNCLKWKPIADFSGDFDGGGYAVENLLVNEGESQVGFFGIIRGINSDSLSDAVSVHDFGVASGSVTGLHTVGGIAGKIERAKDRAAVTVERCWNAASVSGTGAQDSTESTLVGGIVGSAFGTVSNCYNTGLVTAAKKYAGGIAGTTAGVSGYTRVESCYNTGDVTALSSTAGAVSGWHNNAMSPTSNCYYLNNGLPAFGNVEATTEATPLTDAQMKSWNAAYLLNGSAYVGSADGTEPASTAWTTDEQRNGPALQNGGYPVFGDLDLEELTVTLDPNEISTATGGSKKTTGGFMDGLLPKTLSGSVTLEKAPANPSGVTLANAADVDAAFSTWGTTSANGKFALAAGDVSLTPSSATGDTSVLGTDLAGIDLHTAAAYTSGDARSTSFVVADDYAHYKVSVTVKPVESKTLDVVAPVETSSSFELSPDGEVHQGDDAAKAAAPSTLKSNNALPVAGSVKSVVPMALNTELSVGDKVNAVLDPVAESNVLKATSDPVTQPGNAKLFVLGSDGTGELAKLDASLYYDPVSAKVPLGFSVPGGEGASWKWGMDYTGTYIGTTGVFGYTVGYDLRLSENDVAAPVLSAGAK